MGLDTGQGRNQPHRNPSLQLRWKGTLSFATICLGFGVGEGQGKSPGKYQVSPLTRCCVIPLLMLFFVLIEKKKNILWSDTNLTLA